MTWGEKDMSAKHSIAFLGTGIMGLHMARRLAQAGYRVTAWNRTLSKAEPLKEFGVEIADSAGDAARGADIAIVMVSDGPASDEVILGKNGILALMGEGSTLLVMS